jgi:hypothetical protein
VSYYYPAIAGYQAVRTIDGPLVGGEFDDFQR